MTSQLRTFLPATTSRLASVLADYPNPFASSLPDFSQQLCTNPPDESIRLLPLRQLLSIHHLATSQALDRPPRLHAPNRSQPDHTTTRVISTPFLPPDYSARHRSLRLIRRVWSQQYGAFRLTGPIPASSTTRVNAARHSSTDKPSRCPSAHLGRLADHVSCRSSSPDYARHDPPSRQAVAAQIRPTTPAEPLPHDYSARCPSARFLRLPDPASSRVIPADKSCPPHHASTTPVDSPLPEPTTHHVPERADWPTQRLLNSYQPTSLLGSHRLTSFDRPRPARPHRPTAHQTKETLR